MTKEYQARKTLAKIWKKKTEIKLVAKLDATTAVLELFGLKQNDIIVYHNKNV